MYLKMNNDKYFKNIFAFDRRIPFDRDILRSGLNRLPVCFENFLIFSDYHNRESFKIACDSLRELQLRYRDYGEDEQTDPEDSSERVDLRPSLLVRVSQLSSFFIFWLYDASNPDSTCSDPFINFDIEPKLLQEMRNLNRRSKIFPIVMALNVFFIKLRNMRALCKAVPKIPNHDNGFMPRYLVGSVVVLRNVIIKQKIGAGDGNTLLPILAIQDRRVLKGSQGFNMFSNQSRIGQLLLFSYFSD